jgi:type III restriction enzyme
MRLALKLATRAGKTTVMAMLIAWQTINAVRRSTAKHFTRGFLVCAPGLTIKDRLRVLHLCGAMGVRTKRRCFL